MIPPFFQFTPVYCVGAPAGGLGIVLPLPGREGVGIVGPGGGVGAMVSLGGTGLAGAVGIGNGAPGILPGTGAAGVG